MDLFTLGWVALIIFFVFSLALTVWGRGGL
ncbi:cytochrome b6-f complex subunit PetN [Anthocerotibacter panamensis]|nr:cytochrome b6-f complex subunit PetN [Anthocerotibacter panamensis]